MRTETTAGECRLGVVAIGRNEGERLAICLRSLEGQAGRMVYVDSGSRDGSPERARAFGVPVTVLQEGPYTAARGRQTGVEQLLERDASLEYVMFVDGDCRVEDGWIWAAVRYLDGHPGAAAVCGRRREERVDESFWSRVLDIDWEGPASDDAAYVGGDSVVRLRALQDVGGWNTGLIAGEEPDLCFRLRTRGWTIGRLDRPMTTHDAGMRRFGEYWRRSIRAGHAWAEVGWRHRSGPGRPWLRRAIGCVAYGGAVPLASAGAAPFWPPALLLWALAWGRVTWAASRAARRQGRDASTSLAYGLLNAVCKVPKCWGVGKLLIGRLRGRKTRLIEYKADTRTSEIAPAADNGADGPPGQGSGLPSRRP